MKINLKKNKGITLIALVITIIVLLILAGVSIAMLTGQNGILTQASNAKEENSRAQIYEALKLTEQNYQIDIATSASTDDIVTYLQNKGIIDSNLIINVSKLLGYSSETGNGSGTSDVYKLEEITAIGKVASMHAVRVASTSVYMGKKYEVVYYDKNGKRIVLGTISDAPKQIEVIEPENINDWTYTIDEENNTATLTSYKGKDTTVVFPNYINGIPVKRIQTSISGIYRSIWDDTLLDYIDSSSYTYPQTTITKVVISEGIEEIDSCTFYDSQALEEIELPNTLKYIGDMAFYRCKALQNVTIPESVIEIGNYAFFSCTSLTNITIPESVKNMGIYVFDGDTIEINVPFKEGEEPVGWADRWSKNYSGDITVNYNK